MLAFVSTNKILQIFYRKRTVPVALCKILLGLSKSSSSHYWTVISSIERHRQNHFTFHSDAQLRFSQTYSTNNWKNIKRPEFVDIILPGPGRTFAGRNGTVQAGNGNVATPLHATIQLMNGRVRQAWRRRSASFLMNAISHRRWAVHTMNQQHTLYRLQWKRIVSVVYIICQ